AVHHFAFSQGLPAFQPFGPGRDYNSYEYSTPSAGTSPIFQQNRFLIPQSMVDQVADSFAGLVLDPKAAQLAGLAATAVSRLKTESCEPANRATWSSVPAMSVAFKAEL